MEELSQAEPGGEPERPQADAIWNIKVGPALEHGAPVLDPLDFWFKHVSRAAGLL